MGGRGRSYILFIGGLAAIVAGFWPSFFSNPLSNDAWHILHGVAATLWVLLLITQSLLIGRGNRRWHERLGWLSLGLFATLLATTGYMIWVEVTGPEPFPAVVRQALVFLDVLFLILFIALYALGLNVRGTPRLHARLMGSTILIGLGPALVRLYGQYLPQSWGISGGVLFTFGTIEAILVVAIVLAFRRRQSMRPFPELLAAFILIQTGLPWAMSSTFARMLRAAGAPI
ncbi:hypothetical protein EAH87_05780 [Sphingomonas koreensis]|nr:hypothetical protein EAH87_05780 [Sphingomonas koreensis]